MAEEEFDSLIKEAASSSNVSLERVIDIAEHMKTYVQIGSPHGKDFDGFYTWYRQNH